MIVLLTTADTEILAAAGAVETLPAGFPRVRCDNPSRAEDRNTFLDEVLTGARAVLVRLLGGRRAWREGLEELSRRCAADGIPLVAVGGEAEPDAELTALSTAPAGVVAEAFEYLRHGGVENTAQLLRFLADTLLLEGFGFDPPAAIRDFGLYAPGRGDVTLEQATARHDPDRPTVAVVFYRTHRIAGNTGFVDALVGALEAAGANPLALWCYSLRPDERGRVDALELLRDRVDALVATVLASGGSNGGDALAGAGDDRPPDWLDWRADALAQLDVPVLQGICATVPRGRWAASDSGLSPLDAAMQVAIPEFDGRIVGVPFSFKESAAGDSAVGAPLVSYVADRERTARLAELAVRLARLRRRSPAQARLAIVLSNYPTRHSRVGNAVGLDTPASAIVLLDALREAGYRVTCPFESGDELVHALIAAGGHDQEFLTDAQLHGADGRLDAGCYAEWFSALPAQLREAVVEHWGQPPGDLYVDRGDLVVAGLELGNVILAIQPPRGFGENPVAIYHDPDLPPTHHYLAAYWWLDRVFGADAVIHLGKHGTLEWLPGKGLGLSDACAPDAALGSLPLFYPFVVNDPGEGEQAKRRAHAVVIDHLVAPMARAETYDELARLEQLLDEYAQLEALDPDKLPALAGRIWELVREAELHHDLELAARPEDFAGFINHLDGYLCEVKDLQIRDGLHVLGQAPAGEQRLGLLAAILRLGAGRVPGLRRAVAAAFGLDEPSLAADPGARIQAPPALCERFPGPAVTGGDLIDRLEDAQRALLEALESRGFEHDACQAVCTEVIGHLDPGVVAALGFACREVVPRLERTGDEVGNLLRGLAGRFVPSGPSGSPTRGLVNVLPTGRNFYSVDPRALPSELSYETGTRLADDLLTRHLADDGTHPETVGIVVWGTAAMRTHGDDVAEILALLGVRPRWNPESRRVTGLEVVPLDELGRPRIDVTVRISGFFRDAFPHLVALIDEAVVTVAGLDEPEQLNFVRRHALDDRDRLVAELGEPAAWRRATTRVFGSKPGAYGAGLLALIDARNWRTDADLAEVYEVWGGYAYGQGLDGVQAREAMRDSFGRIDVAVKNVDTREHDLFDSDDFFQYHGGMVAAVRALTGAEPKAYVGDSSDPGRVRTRSLQEETRRVFRARVANPRWIAAMRRHGYKGAFELSATVDYLFGYDATAGVVDDWMYETLAAKYVLDAEVAGFMRDSNPWALRAISERLLEAADRGLWEQPADATLDALRDGYLELEGELEEVGT
ncbi:MAG: cobaltochelatase subunit CobN [Solirubrobacteraceae bacterium]